jgi:hypothetical protein
MFACSLLLTFKNQGKYTEKGCPIFQVSKKWSRSENASKNHVESHLDEFMRKKTQKFKNLLKSIFIFIYL